MFLRPVLQLGIGKNSSQGHEGRGKYHEEEACLFFGAGAFIASREKDEAFDGKGDGDRSDEYIDAFGPDLRDEEEDDGANGQEYEYLAWPAVGILLGKKAGKILLQVRKIRPGQKTSSYQQEGCCNTYPLRIFHDAK